MAPTRPPIFVTQQRKLREFLEDQDRIATIKADWLYRMGSQETRARLVRQAGFTPVVRAPSGELLPA